MISAMDWILDHGNLDWAGAKQEPGGFQIFETNSGFRTCGAP